MKTPALPLMPPAHQIALPKLCDLPMAEAAPTTATKQTTAVTLAADASSSLSSSSSSSSSSSAAASAVASSSSATANSSVPLVSLEAIIGAGKSTLLESIKRHFGDAVVVVPEPVGVWTDVDGHNLLSRYYGDQERWAFSFQTFAIFSRLRAVREALQSEVVPGKTRAVIMERSWTSDRECFAALLHDSGAMDPLEEAMHRRIFDWEHQAGGWPVIDGE